MLEKIISQNKDYELKKALQIDSYYRESGTSVLQEIMMEWTVLATDFDAMGKTNAKQIRQLIQKTIGYASENTIKLTSQFFQYMYLHSDDESVGTKGIVYLSMIVASLKKDFTGENIEPIEILKMTLKDFSDGKKMYKNYINEINQSIQ
ncbi:hypothetical protein R078131_00491 [Convivina intestini]|nr:hypothetical protein R078131_00491 [Convivina intestini]